MPRRLATAALCLWAVLSTIPLRADEVPSGDAVEFFTRPGCVYCERGAAFLEDLARRRPGMSVTRRDVASEPEALARLRGLAEAEGVTPAVPAFYLRGRLVVGFEGAETTGRRIEAVWDGREEGQGVRVPLLGEVTLDRLGLPLFTIVLGLVDGFNPCAMWVLLFLLALLVNLKNRPKMAAVAGTFVIASAAVYYAFMAAWLEFFLLTGLSGPVRIVLGTVAVVFGAVNMKDFVAFGRGISISIPEAAKPGIYRRVQKILNAENLLGAIAGVFVLAVLVNFVELLCTAGIPAVYTHVLASQPIPRWAYYAYLGLYAAAYMLDDSVMVAIAVVTLGRRKLQERGGRVLKLMSGLVLVVLGCLLIFRPEWLSALGGK